MFMGMNDSETSDEDLERMEDCYRTLLDAGSDILSVDKHGLDPDSAWDSAFYKALYKGTLVRHLYRHSVDAMQLIISRLDLRR